MCQVIIIIIIIVIVQIGEFFSTIGIYTRG